MGAKIEQYKIVCRECKKEVYVYHHNERYCSNECRIKAKKKRDMESSRRRNQSVKSIKLHVKAGRKEKKKTLAEIAAEAKEHGMSYGQYVNYMYQKGE